MLLNLDNLLWKPAYDDPIISEKEAIDIANAFFEKNLEAFFEYELLSCNFIELQEWQYDINYYRPVSGYKSDDIANIWIKSTGEVLFYSARKLHRYDDVKLSEESIKAAEEKLIRKLDGKFGKGKYSVQDSCIRKDDEGYMILEYEVVLIGLEYDVVVMDDENWADILSQRIE